MVWRKKPATVASVRESFYEYKRWRRRIFALSSLTAFFFGCYAYKVAIRFVFFYSGHFCNNNNNLVSLQGGARGGWVCNKEA